MQGVHIRLGAEHLQARFCTALQHQVDQRPAVEGEVQAGVGFVGAEALPTGQREVRQGGLLGHGRLAKWRAVQQITSGREGKLEDCRGEFPG